MRVFVILYGCASKPELSDEMKGFFLKEEIAKAYCAEKNKIVREGYVYWYERVEAMPV